MSQYNTLVHIRGTIADLLFGVSEFREMRGETRKKGENLLKSGLSRSSVCYVSFLFPSLFCLGWSKRPHHLHGSIVLQDEKNI